MKLGLVYDLRDDYLALGFSEEQTAALSASLAGTSSASGAGRNLRAGWRTGSGSISSSPSPKVCRAARARPRFRRSARCLTSPTPSPIR